MEVWRRLDTGQGSGLFNMAVDEVLMQSVARLGSSPVLRLFGWEPPAISFGYNQDPLREVDVERCREAGVDLVRRPTGGRAVLHAEELTYSVVFRQGHPSLGENIEETHRIIGQCLVEGLRLFGVEASLVRVGGRPIPPRACGATLPCFSSASRWEVECEGRKLIGSAQRRCGEAVLQHGSLLIGPAYLGLPDLLAAMSEQRRREWRMRLKQSSICLEEVVDGPVDVKFLGECLTEGFVRRLSVEMEFGVLSLEEEEEVRRLMEERCDEPFSLWGGEKRGGEVVRRASVER